jgi:ribosomal protein S21
MARPDVAQRGHNGLVLVQDGNVNVALKKLKNSLADAGVLRLMKPTSRLYSYTKPGQAQGQKQTRTRRRVKKLALAQTQYDDQRELRGM